MVDALDEVGEVSGLLNKELTTGLDLIVLDHEDQVLSGARARNGLGS